MKIGKNIILFAIIIALFLTLLLLFKSATISLIFLLAALFVLIASISVPRVHIFGPTINHGDQGKKQVSLTFDDGPYKKATEKILDILENEKTKATFFLLGINAKEQPALVKKIFESGHIIGNHSYNHSKSLFLAAEKEYLFDISRTEEIINSIVSKKPRFYRSPWGLKSPDMFSALGKRGNKIILWNIITLDPFKWCRPESIVDRVLRKLEPGSIIVLHDGRDTKKNYPRENVIKALPGIIDGIRAKGYEIVPLDQLIGEKAYF